MDSTPLFTRRDVLRTGAGIGVGTTGVAGCLGTELSDETGSTDTTTGTTETDTSIFEPPQDVCRTDSSVGGSGPLFRSVDSRGTYRCVGRPLDSMENLDRWQADTGRLDADGETAFSGTQSARIEAEPSDERAVVHRSFPGGVDLSERDLSLAVHPGAEHPADNVIVQLFAPDARNRIDHWQHLGPADSWKRLDLGPTKVVGDPDLGDVRRLAVVSYTGGGSRVRFYVDEIRTTTKLDQGYVLLTFDDSLTSQYETAFPLTEEFGFPGNVGVIPWKAGSDPYLGQSELAEMREAGWDVVSHPQREEPLPDLSAEKQRAAIEEAKGWLVDRGFERGARFAIWPYGATNETTLDVGSDYHALGFAGGVHPSGCPFMGPLSVSRVNGDDVERTRKVVDFALEYNQVAVVVYHPIGVGATHVSEAAFEETLQSLADRRANVVTASHLWDEVVP